MKKITRKEFEGYIEQFKNGIEFKTFPEEARSNSGLAKYALKVNPHNVEFIWDELYGNRELLWLAITWDVNTFPLFLNKMKNKEDIYHLSRYDPEILRFASEETLSNADKMDKFIFRIKDKALKYIDKKLLSNKEFAKKIAKHTPWFIKEFSDEIKSDKNLMLECIGLDDPYKINNYFKYWEDERDVLITYISEELKKDKDILEALEKRSKNIVTF